MKREIMKQILQTELKHIPRGLRKSLQNKFRMMYASERMQDLSDNPQTPKNASLQKALEWLRKEHPNEHVEFDSEFFEISP